MASLPKIMQPTQADPLAELRDIHLPHALDQFQLAPGWWILAFLLLLTLAYGIYRLYLRWQHERYRKAGINALNKNLAAYEKHQRLDKFLIDFSIILKRVALTKYPRASVARLTGEAWVAFLDKTGGESNFSMGVGQMLIDGPYELPEDNSSEDTASQKNGSKSTGTDIAALHQLGVKWIRNHQALEQKNVSRKSRWGGRK